MQIIEYDEADPVEILQLNLLGLDFALTPQRVELIRRLDPRPFPFFALYAVVDGVLAGQVGVFRLPMISAEGPEDVGGVWAVLTHPTFTRRKIADQLLNEAHEIMQAEGLRFSTLGTSKFRVAHILYQKQAYRDSFSSSTIFLRKEDVINRNEGLRAVLASSDRLSLADDLFRRVARNRLGFAKRYEPFIPAMVTIGEIAMGKIEENNVWFLWKDDKLVGYFIAKYSESILNILDTLLLEEINPVAAISALTEELSASYIQVKSNNNSLTTSLSKVGGKIIPQDWNTFMIKPLMQEVMNIDLKSFFGISTKRFLFSWMDCT
ncbi:MAG: GNAT family N-acetyltransferase [Promethearchaeota archaeon]